MKNDLDNTLRRKFWRCYSGWFAWKRVMIKTHTRLRGKNKTVVLVLSSDNREYNYYGLLYLPSYMMKNGYERAVVIGYDEAAIKAAKLFSNKIAYSVRLSKKSVSDIMDLYTLYRFRKHLVIADLDRPNGRNGRALVGKRGITVEDMICVGVYELYPVRRPSGPMYAGVDYEIKAFLSGEK